MVKLKVFRTPIGFHDAYVAAPSQKAALAAWGADADLFARGVAERVSDPRLAAEPLEKPGEVIRRTRGTAAEHLAALPRDRARRHPEAAVGGRDTTEKSGPAEKPRASIRKSSPRRRPRPSREKLDALERELDALAARQRREMREIAAELARVERQKASLGLRHDRERAALQHKLDRVKSSHERAVRVWRAQL
ncbi:hypothetical protein [Sphingomonas colocasiae]|uniref:Cell envelope biogenesis protein TolA n=1 Tax=Sphingomonas colocasiae TaxID=1848973 RepID=A0ABS7PQE8_9SPHN|nr:hypothetical protein [Sphingomonas colocasiae]MBY8823476.1 hypothetical protein [Sphingomonas colocasiae]